MNSVIVSCIILILSVTSFFNECRCQGDRFDEELVLKPLPSSHLYAYFQFTTLWNVSLDSSSFQHCHLFPRALGEILTRYNVQELHISLTEGLWKYEYWGYPVFDAAPGAELWVWFKNNTEDIDTIWKELTGALSGLLCASLNFIDGSNTLSPEFTFRPAGVSVNSNINSSFVRYATLPREIVCTENLTPWKKLLPCDCMRGLATLLNAGHIYNTNYHSLGLHFRSFCHDNECLEPAVELRQVLSLVYDMMIIDSQSQDWSLRKLFGLGLGGPCPLTSTSTIYVDMTANETGVPFRLQPEPTDMITSLRGGYETTLYVYDVRKMDADRMINIAAMYSGPKVYYANVPSVLFANRYIVGYGQERGGIVTKIRNNHWKPLDIVFLENIPWFLPVYLHTLRIVSNGKEIQPVLKKYIPGKERTRPYYLELLLELPARSVTEIHIEFDYVFLKWQEYPPDANHGFYIGSAIITALLPVGRHVASLPQKGSLVMSSFKSVKEGYLVQLRTEILIITLPTPDFSMPYNVICLACTVVALAFGPLHNITTKRLCLKDSDSPTGVLTWVKSKFSLKKKNLTQEDPATETHLPQGSQVTEAM